MTEDTGRPENARFLRLAWKIGAVGLFIFIVGCFFVDPLSWGLGVLLGAVCTLVRYGMMEHSLKQTLQKENGSRAAQYALVQFLLRELLFVVVFVLAVFVPWIHPLGVVLAIIGSLAANRWQRGEDKRQGIVDKR